MIMGIHSEGWTEWCKTLPNGTARAQINSVVGKVNTGRVQLPYVPQHI